jgi:HlyD family secretion protein
MIQGTEHQDILLTATKKTGPAPIVIALAIGALALAIVLFRLGPNASVVLPKKQVQIATVIRGDLVRDIAVQGKVVAAKAPTLFSQVEGVVNFIKQPGEAVVAGDLLAVIESPELENNINYCWRV